MTDPWKAAQSPSSGLVDGLGEKQVRYSTWWLGRGGRVASQGRLGYSSHRAPQSSVAQPDANTLLFHMWCATARRQLHSIVLFVGVFFCSASMNCNFFPLASRKGPWRNTHTGIFFSGKEQDFRGEREGFGSALGFTLALMWASAASTGRHVR